MSSPFRNLRFLLWSVLLFAAAPLFLPADTRQSTVTIEQARKTSYYTDEATGDEIIIFTGSVAVSVVQDGTTNRITADTVHFNRTQNMLYAEGNVSLDKTSGNDTEHLTAGSLLFNINTAEGIFDSGRFVQSGEKSESSGSTMIVSADIFARNESGAVAFKRGSLTFCDDPNPHWKIKATRIWLLPGNEFAFANALLYIGHIPVMYFPFFYYPKDELVFNPVFGYHSRKGYTIQTTTYLIGRKQQNKDNSENSSSLFNFLNSSEQKKQQLEGLVLRNLDEADTATYPNTLKLIGDYYTNLGGLLGIDGVFKPESSAVTEFSFAAYLGFSRTLFPISSGSQAVYSPYGSDGQVHYNKTSFMGVELPFRLKTNLKLSVKSPFTLNLSIPVYTDAFFDSDFITDRKESMDWIDYLLDGTEEDDTDDSSSTGEISSFTWSLSGSYTPKIPALAPYIQTLTVSPSASVLFSAKTDTDGLLPAEYNISPSRRFFYPSQIKPFALSMRISGTLFSYPGTTSTKTNSGTAVSGLQLPEEFGGTTGTTVSNNPQFAGAEPGTNTGSGTAPDPADSTGSQSVPDTAAATEDEETTEQAASSSQQTATETGTREAENANITGNTAVPEDVPFSDMMVIPLLPVADPSLQNIGGLTYSLTYNINPSLSTEIAYNSPARRTDFAWDELKSTFYVFKSPVDLTSTLGWRNSFISLTNSLSFSPVIQRHPIYNDESSRNTAIKNDYTAQKLDFSNSNALSLKPFVYNPIFKNTSLSWNTGIKLIRTSFIGTVEKPEWEYLFPEWNEDTFSTHTLNFTFSAEEGDFYQRLVLTTNLPPRVDSYSGTLTLGFPFINVSTSTGIKQTSSTNPDWELMPLKQSANISILSDKLKLTQSYEYNLEEQHTTSFSAGISGYNASLNYTMLYTNGYTYDSTVGWKTKTEKEFQPVSLQLKYNTSSGLTFRFLNDTVTLKPALNTVLYMDMMRPTSSYFTFTPSVTFTVNEFLDVSFSASSRNRVVYRYIQKYIDSELEIPGETNIFKDLCNSFAFGNQALRESSGFKLESLSVKLTHDLHDWKLTSEFEITPRVITENGVKKYDFSPYFTLSVLWKPMESMKTTIEDEYGTFTLNP